MHWITNFKWVGLFVVAWVAAVFWWHDYSFRTTYLCFSGQALIIDKTLASDFSEPDEQGIVDFKFRVFNPGLTETRLIGAEVT